MSPFKFCTAKLYFLCLTALLLLSCTPFALAQSARPSILVLHSYHPAYSWTRDIEAGIEKQLKASCELFTLYLDANRQNVSEFEDLYCEAIRRMGVSSFNAVLCADDPAIDFVIKYRDEFFSSLPVVFCGANNFDPARIEHFNNITGINEEISFAENLSFIVSARPKMGALAVIADSTLTGQRNLALFKDFIKNTSQNFSIEYFDRLPIEELKQSLMKLSPDDAVLYLSYLKPPTGKILTIEESCKLVLEASPAPVFGCWDFLIGTGFVGGKVVCAHNQGESAAIMLQQILTTVPEKLPTVHMQSPNRFLFDYNALLKHGIDLSILPESADIINNPLPDLWSYWPWFLSGFIALMLQSGLIIKLFRSMNAIASEEARHQAMLANIADVIAIIDADGINRYKSANVEKLFGWKPEELVGQKTWKNVHPDDLAATQAVFAGLLNSSNIKKTATCRYLCKDGSYRWIEFTAANHLSNKIISGVLLNYHDITERVLAEKEQKDFERKIQQTQRLESLGVLAGGIAHDFNNLLMTIQGYSDLTLSDIPAGSHVGRFVNEIQKATHRAADLCRQMLAYSGRSKFVTGFVDLHKLVKDMTELLQASVTKKARLALQLNGQPPIIEADSTQINQIIMNLVINASEAIGHDHGEIIVKATIVDCDEDDLINPYITNDLLPGKYACIEVSDNGCGMTEDTLKKLFDPFFTTKFTGRGLGMSAVLGIIRGHEGTLQVSSRPGEGTCFCIYFPLAHATLPENEEQHQIEGAMVPAETTVLVVDDEESVRKVVQKMLEILGLKVLLAADGVEAIEIFDKHREDIEIVLLDLTMPKKDGYATLKELRQISPDLKIIVASGYGEHELHEKFGNQRNIGFINKPYSMELIKTEMLRLFHQF